MSSLDVYVAHASSRNCITFVRHWISLGTTGPRWAIVHHMEGSATDLRCRRDTDTASRLIGLARRHTAARGLNGSTVETLCTEALISRRTFCNYFAPKDATVLGIPLPREHLKTVFAFLAGTPTGSTPSSRHHNPARSRTCRLSSADIHMGWLLPLMCAA